MDQIVHIIYFAKDIRADIDYKWSFCNCEREAIVQTSLFIFFFFWYEISQFQSVKMNCNLVLNSPMPSVLLHSNEYYFPNYLSD